MPLNPLEDGTEEIKIEVKEIKKAPLYARPQSVHSLAQHSSSILAPSSASILKSTGSLPSMPSARQLGLSKEQAALRKKQAKQEQDILLYCNTVLKKYEQAVHQCMVKHITQNKPVKQDDAFFAELKRLEANYHAVLSHYISDKQPAGREAFFRTNRGMAFEVYCLNNLLHMRLLAHNTVELWRTYHSHRKIDQPTGMEKRDWEKFVKKIDKRGQEKKADTMTPFRLAALLRRAVKQGAASIRRVFAAEPPVIPFFQLSGQHSNLWQRHKQFFRSVKLRFFPPKASANLPEVEELTSILSEEELRNIHAEYHRKQDAHANSQPHSSLSSPPVERIVIGDSSQDKKKEEAKKTNLNRLHSGSFSPILTEDSEDVERISPAIYSSHKAVFNPQQRNHSSLSSSSKNPDKSLIKFQSQVAKINQTSNEIVSYCPSPSSSGNILETLRREDEFIQHLTHQMTKTVYAYVDYREKKFQQEREEDNRRAEQYYQERLEAEKRLQQQLEKDCAQAAEKAAEQNAKLEQQKAALQEIRAQLAEITKGVTKQQTQTDALVQEEQMSVSKQISSVSTFVNPGETHGYFARPALLSCCANGSQVNQQDNIISLQNLFSEKEEDIDALRKVLSQILI